MTTMAKDTLHHLITRAAEGYNMGYRLQVESANVADPLTKLLSQFDAIQTERAERQEEMDELDNGNARDAEERQDTIDGWTDAESEIAHKLVALLRGTEV